ncbi:MAG: tetratricopeptide repeat protein, partial [Rhodospirillaceae bacterium]|nr:tetratricopeptide repeat protein [Rhodospirillaceae bacterium]
YRDSLAAPDLAAEAEAALRYRTGFALLRAGDPTAATAELERAEQRLIAAYGADHPFRVELLLLLRASYFQTERMDRAQAAHAELGRLVALLSDAWAGPAEGGSLVHKASGAAFPPNLGGFERGEATTFVLDGSDVAVGYDGPGGTLTIYVTEIRAGEALEPEFRVAAAEALRAKPDAEVKGTGPVPSWPGGPPDGGLLFLFAFTDPQSGAAVASSLMLFETKGWFVKFRHTYPLFAQEEAQAAITAALGGIGWPTRPVGTP